MTHRKHTFFDLTKAQRKKARQATVSYQVIDRATRKLADWVWWPFRAVGRLCLRLVSLFRPQPDHFQFVPGQWADSHAGIFGQTKAGKSTLMISLYQSLLALNDGSASVVIDPHGDFAKALCRLNTDQELIFLSPFYGFAANRFPVMNPLELNTFIDSSSAIKNPDSLNRTLDLEYRAFSVADSLQEITANLSPNMHILLRACCQTLVCMPNTDLRDLVRFMDERTMQPYLEYADKHLPQDTLKHFLRNHFVASKKTREAVAFRLMGLLSSSSFTHLTCGRSTIDLKESLNQGHHLLFDLSGLPQGVADAFGRLILSQLKALYLERARQPKTKRRTIRLWVDEAPRFLGASFAEILQESRKFGFLTVFAAQSYLQTLKPAIRESLRTNTAIKITGRASHQSLKAFADDTQADLDLLNALRQHRFYYYHSEQAQSRHYAFQSRCLKPQRASKRSSAFFNRGRKMGLRKCPPLWADQATLNQRRQAVANRYYRPAVNRSATAKARNSKMNGDTVSPPATILSTDSTAFFPLHL